MMPEPFPFVMEVPLSSPCRIKQGWSGAGKQGLYYGKIRIRGGWWAIVQWEDDDDPDMLKIDAIEVCVTTRNWVAAASIHPVVENTAPVREIPA